ADIQRRYSPPPLFDATQPQRNTIVATSPNGVPLFMNRREYQELQSLIAGGGFVDANAQQTAAMVSMLSGLWGTRLAIAAGVDPPRSASAAARLDATTASRRVAALESRTLRMVGEVEKSAMAARMQLAADVAALERRNAEIRETNDRVLTVLKPLGD